MTNNTLAFIALCNEYCSELEKCSSADKAGFVAKMLRLLPRIYICAADLDEAGALDEGYLDPSLEEDYYDEVRRNISLLMGEDDTYLEVFEEDMKFSDTPIGASVSEGLADLFQVFYNFIEAVKDAPEPIVASAVSAVKEDFRNYWAQTLCNVMRPLNAIRYNG